ncbi:MAG: M50 family metallopeptidase [Planctomycetes bacterium]|nr:M50 family metallopeptidase [Planctomycetota bacterium]
MPRPAVHWKELATLLAIGLAVVFLWDTVAVYPLKVLVVFLHELSHALAALLTGGSVQEIRVDPDQGGSCVTVGGSRFVTLSAGYLGSLAWGGAVLVLATRTRHDRKIAGVLGAVLVAATLAYVRPLGSFGFAFGAAAGALMLLAAARLSHGANDWILKVIGLTSCLYAVLDIKSDVLDRSQAPSDAAMLAEATGVPTLVWGIVWISAAALGALGFLLAACRK